MTYKSNLPSFLLESREWEKGIHPIWLATSMRLHRNAEKYLFPSKLSSWEAHQLLTHLKKMILSLTPLNHPVYLSAASLDTLDREFLFEHFLFLKSLQEVPKEAAFILDSDADLFFLLNAEDHIQIELMHYDEDCEKSYARLAKIDNAINAQLDFAFHPQFGYLTANPSQAGTAFIMRTFLHLPALIHLHQLDKALEQHLEEEVMAINLEGSTQPPTGDLLILSNLYTLGVCEENLLQAIKSSTLHIVAAEELLRSHLKKEASSAIKDQIKRAYGLLTNSYQLEIKEALNAISLLKLAFSLEWISNIEEKTLNRLFFQCQKAHLSYTLDQATQDPSRLQHLRSDFLHDQLKNAHLHM